MVNKWAKQKDWKMSARQVQEREEAVRQLNERQLAVRRETEAAMKEGAMITALLHQFQGAENLHIGAVYRNGLGDMVRLESQNGRLRLYFLSKEEKEGAFGGAWVPILTWGEIGDEYLGHRLPPHLFEAVAWRIVGLSNPIWLHDIPLGIFLSVRQQCKVILAQNENGHRFWTGEHDGNYNAGRAGLYDFLGEEVLWGPGHFPSVQQVPMLNPNADFVLAGGPQSQNITALADQNDVTEPVHVVTPPETPPDIFNDLVDAQSDQVAETGIERSYSDELGAAGALPEGTYGDLMSTLFPGA